MRSSIEVDILYPFMFGRWDRYDGVKQGLRRYSFVQPKHGGLEEEMVFHQKVDQKGIGVTRKISFPLQVENGTMAITSDVHVGIMQKGQSCLIAIHYLPVDAQPTSDNPQNYYPPVFKVTNRR